MTVLVVVLAVALVGVVGWAVLGQRRAAEVRADIESRLQGVVGERDELTGSLAAAERERDEALSRAAAADAARAQATDDLAAERGEHARTRAGVDEVTAQRDNALDRATRLSAVLDALWELERVRATRTWRHSVAVRLDDDDPITGSSTPLTAAITVESQALREEVGSVLVVEVELDEERLTPARRLLILRVAQEMLTEAVREDRPALLRIRGDAPTTLELVGEPGDLEPFVVSPLPVPPHVGAIETTERGTAVILG